MTQDKAREYFSAYHEGTLEAGLRTALARKLETDAAVRAEYDAFVATVVALNALRDEPVSPPLYLAERIAARIDSAKPAPVPFWASLFGNVQTGGPRFVWATGLAACLLVGAVGLRGMQSENSAHASMVGGEGSESVQWIQTPSGVSATFVGGAARTITVLPQGGQPKDYHLAPRQPLELTFSNDNPSARRFTLSSGQDVLATVVVPSRRPSSKRTGAGNIEDLAAALADCYLVPVVVKGDVSEASVRWNFEGSDARVAAEKGLGDQGSAAVMNGNVLQISK